MPTTESSEAPVTGASQTEPEGSEWRRLLPPPGEIALPKSAVARECSELFWNHHDSRSRLLPVIGGDQPELWVRDSAGLWLEADHPSGVHWSVIAALRDFMPDHSQDQIQRTAKELIGEALHRKDAPVRRQDMDSNPRFMAAVNGGIDLATGALLSPEETAACLLSARDPIPTAYRPGANWVDDGEGGRAWHPDLSRFFEPWPREVVEYLLDCHGRTAWGIPHLAWYVIAGETGAGKSALLTSIEHCFGRYALPMHRLTFDKGSKDDNGFLKADVLYAPTRWAVLDEGDDLVLDTALAKEYTTPGRTGIRNRKYEKVATGVEFSSVAWMTANDNQIKSLGADQEAMRKRLKIVRLPRLKVEDEMIGGVFLRSAEAQQALVAEIVERASRNPLPPPEPLFVEEEREARRRVDTGFFVLWCMEHIEITEDVHGDRIYLHEIKERATSSPDESVRQSAVLVNHPDSVLTKHWEEWGRLPQAARGTGGKAVKKGVRWKSDTPWGE